MSELLRMEGTREGGIRRKGMERKDEEEGKEGGREKEEDS
jgi:hypothetical protein